MESIKNCFSGVNQNESDGEALEDAVVSLGEGTSRWSVDKENESVANEQISTEKISDKDLSDGGNVGYEDEIQHENVMHDNPTREKEVLASGSNSIDGDADNEKEFQSQWPELRIGSKLVKMLKVGNLRTMWKLMKVLKE